MTFAQTFGVPVALLAFALVTGAMGKWHFGSSVDARIKEKDDGHARQLQELRDARDRERAISDARLSEKDEQIQAWKTAAELDAKTAQESLTLARESKDALARIEREVSRKPRTTT